METLEVAAMVAALALMSAAVVIKVMTAHLIAHMKHQISQVAQLKASALGRLKMVQGQKSVSEQNKAALLAKKAKLTKKIMRLKKEIGEMREHEEARRQRSEMRKVE